MKGFFNILGLSLLGTGIILGARSQGLLSTLDLALYDRLFPKVSVGNFCSRPIALVEATESDLQEYGYPLPGTVTSRVLATLQSQDASVIGFGLFRDLPQEPGHDDLLQQLAASNVVSIGLRGKTTDEGIPFPPGASHGGFVDVRADLRDRVLRRLTYTIEKKPSYATALAAQHLERPWQEIATRLQPYEIDPYTGPYASFLEVGDEVLVPWLPCRFRTISFQELLSGREKITPGDIVLVGQDASSIADPFRITGGRQFSDSQLHAHFISLQLGVMAGQQMPVRIPGNGAIALGLIVLSLSQTSLIWANRNRHALLIVVATLLVSLIFAAIACGVYIAAFRSLAIWLPIGPVLMIIGINLFAGTTATYIGKLLEKNQQLDRTVSEQADELFDRQKYVNIALLVSGIMHDIHAPINGALNGLGEIKTDLLKRVEASADNPSVGQDFLDVRSDLEEVEDTIKQLSRIVQLVELLEDDEPPEGEFTRVANTIKVLCGFAQKNSTEIGTSIAIEYECPDHVLVKVDEGSLARILINLLNNSIEELCGINEPEFQPRIQIQAEEESDWCKIHVCDNGLGVPDSVRETLFEMTTTTKSGIGRGKGLWIAKTTTEAVGGSLKYSKINGRGCKFSISLPLYGNPG